MYAAPPVASLAADQYGGDLPLLPTPVATLREDETQLAHAVAYFFPQLLERPQRAYVWAVVNERGEVSQIDMDVRPAWDSEQEFARNWREFMERAGVLESQVRQQLVLQIPIGPKPVVVAWVMQRGVAVHDPAAPAFSIARRQAQVMEARMLTTTDAQRRVIEHFDATALSEGVPAGQELWVLIEPDGKVQRAGRRAAIVDPQAARQAMSTCSRKSASATSRAVRP